MRTEVFHIVNWFPTIDSPKNALWVKNHLNAMKVDIEKDVVHIEVKKGNIFRSRFGSRELFGNRAYLIYLPFEIWKIFELISFMLMYWLLAIKKKQIDYQLINIHIAYPLLHKATSLVNRLKLRIVITEHWSAYHFNFNLKDESKLTGIKSIFQNNVPVIAVSRALIQDIKEFSKSDFPSYSVPNTVDTSVFNYTVQPIEKQFFILSLWKYPKNPFSILRVFEEFLQRHHDFKLRIGGYGPQLDEMKTMATDLGISDSVDFLGELNKTEIARELNRSVAFIHISNYETFSVVCAESVCCGCPVVASAVGGIPEFISEDNGLLLNGEQLKLKHLEEISLKSIDRESISINAAKTFSFEQVGKQYSEVLESIVNERF